jgi:hypothetical protein
LAIIDSFHTGANPYKILDTSYPMQVERLETRHYKRIVRKKDAIDCEFIRSRNKGWENGALISGQYTEFKKPESYILRYNPLAISRYGHLRQAT